MNKLFDSNPKIENSKYRIRLVRKKDLKQLLKLYGNKENLKNINVDDCNGDTFYYPTEELLIKKYLFWKHAYENKWFIRQIIFSKIDNKIIGTIEYLKRKGYDSFENAIVIRLDLLLEYENKNVIKEILEFVLAKQLINCNFSKIAIKANEDMEERLLALNEMGFKLSNRKLIGLEDNKQYKNYYIKNKLKKFVLTQKIK
jgi:hypothetical protein